jgi:hypothetical protein
MLVSSPVCVGFPAVRNGCPCGSVGKRPASSEHRSSGASTWSCGCCYRVFTETTSGARPDRPTLEQLMDQLRPGDTLVVWKLDRLGRSLRHLVDTVTGLAERGIGFRSLQEATDTCSGSEGAAWVALPKAVSASSQTRSR